jgi:hypothetical protein
MSYAMPMEICNLPYQCHQHGKLITRRQSGEPTITGPGGIRVKDYPLQMFNYPFDQNTQYIYNQSGQQVRDFPGVEQVHSTRFSSGVPQSGTYVYKIL